MREEAPRGTSRSVDRGASRPAIEPRKKNLVRGADAVLMAEGNTGGHASASACLVSRGRRPWHARTLLAREPGDLSSDQSQSHDWSASGRRGAVVDDERTREVRLRHISDEACEQSWATGRGVGGAKGGDQGKHGPTTHAPGTGPGKRATGAGTCTASSKAAEEGEVHRASAPCHSRLAKGVVLCAQAQGGAWSGWRDVAGLRRGTGGQSPGSA